MPLKRISSAVLPLAGGAIYGLALARSLFETDPRWFALFNTWAGAAGLAALGALGAGAFFLRRPSRAPASAGLYLPLLSVLAPDVNLLRAGTLLVGGLGLCLALARERQGKGDKEQDGEWAEPLLGPFLFFSLFLLFLSTLGRYVGEADPFEFQVTAARLGIAHGAGYPLLMLLARVFTLLPVGGTLAFRANLTAAFFGALAAVGVQRLARRLGANPLTAFLAGFLFGVSPTLWARSTELEAYTLNAAILAGLLNLSFNLIEYRPSPSDLRPPTSVVYSAAFLWGLGLTNHLTTLLAAPALGLAALVAFARWRAAARQTLDPALVRPIPRFIKQLALSAGFALLGYAVYLYLPLRWPAVNHGELLSLKDFLYLLRGGSATGEFDLRLILSDVVRWGSLLRKVGEQYTWVGLGLAALGVVALALGRRYRWQLMTLLLTYVVHALFIMAYNTRDPDWSDFFIPLHLLAAVFIGLGVQAVIDSQNRIRAPTTRSWVLGIVYCVFCVLPLRSVWLTLPQVDRSRNSAGYLAGQYSLSYPLARGAAILADPAHFAPLYYLQAAEGVRPDLEIMILPDERTYRAQLDERLAAGQVVYLARYLPGLGSFYSLRSVGPLAEVSATPFTAPPESAQPPAESLASHIQLLGFDADSLTAAAPAQLRLTLHWHITEPADDNYLVHLRLRRADGATAWQSAGSIPVNGLYPTNAWKPGEFVDDFHALPIDASLAPGDYQLEVGLFPPFQASDRGWVRVAPVTVAAPAESPQPPHPVRAQFGPNWLMGYSTPESAAPGSMADVNLYWMHSAGSDTVTAFGETRSLAAWPVGSVVPVKYQLALPAVEGPHPLEVAGPAGARCGWLSPATTSCRLATINLIGAAIEPGAVNFDNQLVLRRADFGPATIERGGTVTVDIEWQALQSISEDYTVFVHLVGPDGQLHGQMDYYPVRGTLPTSHWQPGQVIRDSYTVLVPADAPPGEYTIHIGLYLLATLDRLPVLNAAGRSVDDKYVLTGFSVR